ncbi:MAG: hypothetical protein JWP79_1792 [Polaromonas sp.]|jgi:hypothetical protein|nr:hypothetical protein [Polaromonas sp.]MDB5844482.1 hypothetical protein [Polaromonas sp.]
MGVVLLTVTEFSRGLSDFLNQVQYQGQSLNIQRGRRVVARVLPAVASDGFALDRLDDFLAQGSQLSSDERQAMADDLAVVRSQLGTPDDPWAL